MLSFGLPIIDGMMISSVLMFRETCNFRDFLLSEEGIASNILSDRLAMLEKEEIIVKTKDPDNKLKYIYSLTKRGIDLLPILVEMGRWSVKYKPIDIKKHKYAISLVKGGKELHLKIRKELIKKHIE